MKSSIVMLEFFVTGFYSGYLKKAPGTWGSWVAVCLYCISFSIWKSAYILSVLFFCIIFFAGWWSVFIFLEKNNLQKQDPSFIVVDEFAGMWITYFGINFSLQSILLGFLLFRIFDILKPWPINFFDNKKKAFGIMMDDVVAGIYSCLFLHLLTYIL